MKPLSITVTANNFFQYDVSGLYVSFLACSGNLTVKTDAGEVTELRAGLRWFPQNKFQWLRFENESGTDITLKFQAGLDRIDDNSSQVTVNSHPVSQDPTSNPWITKNKALGSAVLVGPTAVSGTAVTLTGAPANNRRVTLQTSGWLYYGPAGVTVATGIELAPNSEVELDDCNWEVFGISSGTASVKTLIERD